MHNHQEKHFKSPHSTYRCGLTLGYLEPSTRILHCYSVAGIPTVRWGCIQLVEDDRVRCLRSGVGFDCVRERGRGRMSRHQRANDRGLRRTGGGCGRRYKKWVDLRAERRRSRLSGDRMARAASCACILEGP